MVKSGEAEGSGRGAQGEEGFIVNHKKPKTIIGFIRKIN